MKIIFFFFAYYFTEWVKINFFFAYYFTELVKIIFFFCLLFHGVGETNFFCLLFHWVGENIYFFFAYYFTELVRIIFFAYYFTELVNFYFLFYFFYYLFFLCPRCAGWAHRCEQQLFPGRGHAPAAVGRPLPAPSGHEATCGHKCEAKWSFNFNLLRD